MDRKLAAILAADVVGYSALMERDEAGTLERLVAGRKELFEPEIARHHGRIFKLMGDGLLAEFGSVVDAVECAVACSAAWPNATPRVPDDQRIQVRIGINLGEVIVEGEDRYGEGVNIAARLEQLAEPGGICVSAKVAREVEKKLAFGFEPMGEQKVKNIAEPVQAYRVRLDGRAGQDRRRLGATPRALRLAAVAVCGCSCWPAGRSHGAAVEARSRGGRCRRAGGGRRQTLAGRAAVRQSERRQGAGLSRRRLHRGPDDRACARARPVRHLPQRRLHLQGQGHAAGADRRGTRRPLHRSKAASAASATTCASTRS